GGGGGGGSGRGGGGGGARPADHQAGQWPLDLRADPVRERGRQEADHRDDRRDDDRAEADVASFDDRVAQREPVGLRLTDRRDQDDAVQDADPEHGDVAHRGRDVEVGAPDVERQGAADQGERQV